MLDQEIEIWVVAAFVVSNPAGITERVEVEGVTVMTALGIPLEFRERVRT